MEHYEIMEQIGRVAFGAVILVHHKSENKKAELIKRNQMGFISPRRKLRLVRKYHQVGPRNFATRRDSRSRDLGGNDSEWRFEIYHSLGICLMKSFLVHGRRLEWLVKNLLTVNLGKEIMRL
ncbi:hypothetical protein V6N13_029878 [Hibiscus sabdariffa]|uniref:Uncharacterized protein n=2 Tax=Hibiscus sabdariffa TaxID=183260 RepID=A0ABR2A262_9ROSI